MDKRNLVTRILSALVLIPIVLFCILEGGYYYLGFITVATVLATAEFIKLAEKKPVEFSTLVSYLSALMLPYLFFLQNFEYITFFIISLLVLIQFFELKKLSESPVLSTSVNFLLIGYIHLFLSTSIYVRENYSELFDLEYSTGGIFLLMIFLAIWACDTFAYLGGSTYGKRKLYQKVSPKKSIEGALTGLLGSIVVVFIIRHFYLNELPLVLAVMICFLIGVGGQIGDLIESMYKRDAEIKDSGKTIPGHGGVLDRIDSFIYVSPLIFIVLKLYEYHV